MTSLREMQRGFAAAIRDPAAAARFAPRVNAGGLGPSRRLQLYRNNHYATLTDALTAVYPVVVRLVGEPFFRQTARAYVASHPSRRGDIHCYGDGFGDFLNGLPQAADYPYLGDVARLEWAYHSVFHTEPRPPFDPQTLLTLDQGDYPRLRLEIQPAARLLASGYPVLRIWETNQEGWEGKQDLRLDAGGDYLLITRGAAEVLLVTLGPGEHRLLQGLAAGLTLSEAQASAQIAEPGFDSGPALRRHLSLATLVGWRL
ncbi:MAG: DNA-binding domain-containing protein [Chromatiaceae bacterium]|nr:DNA-binding domain-containing protein [Chromatiaceae bacterium]